MKIKNRTRYLLFLILIMGFQDSNAQVMEIKLDLPEEYGFRMKSDSADADLLLASYEAVNPRTQIAPFEIMVSSMNVSLMPRTMEEWIASVAEVVRSHTPSARLETVREEGTKRLYLIESGKENSCILILMQKTASRFIMIEAEIPPKELLVVAKERWAEIFWNAKVN